MPLPAGTVTLITLLMSFVISDFFSADSTEESGDERGVVEVLFTSLNTLRPSFSPMPVGSILYSAGSTIV